MMFAKMDATMTSRGKPGEEIQCPDGECRILRRGKKNDEKTGFSICRPE
ncbi:hypothetical protein [Labrenzia sp. MBR-25]